YYALTQVYINFSQEYIKQNEFQNARESLSKALINAEKSQDIIREAAVWNMFGLYYKALSYKDSTVYALEKGLHLSKESGNKRNILLAYEELANYYQLIGDSKLALAFFSEAYTLKDVVYSESKTTVAQH